MIPTALVDLLQKAHLSNWRVSREGEKGKPVTSGSCGVRLPSSLWVRFSWTDAAGEHRLFAERDLADSAAVIAFDGEKLAGEMHVKKHLGSFGISLEVSLELPGQTLRFDGDLRLG